MLAESHQDDFSLFQQAKSGKHGSEYFCVASSGTNIKLRIVVRNSAWGSYVSILAHFGDSGPSLPFHPHLTSGECEERRSEIEHVSTQGAREGMPMVFPKLFQIYNLLFIVIACIYAYAHTTHC